MPKNSLLLFCGRLTCTRMSSHCLKSACMSGDGSNSALLVARRLDLQANNTPAATMPVSVYPEYMVL